MIRDVYGYVKMEILKYIIYYVDGNYGEIDIIKKLLIN